MGNKTIQVVAVWVLLAESFLLAPAAAWGDTKDLSRSSIQPPAQLTPVSPDALRTPLAPRPEALQMLPDDGKALYHAMTPVEKARLCGQIHGKTETPFGTVDNLSAFVSGEVSGVNTFTFLKADLSEKFNQKKLPPEDYQRRLNAIEILSKLTPKERQALVLLLDEGLKARRPVTVEDKLGPEPKQSAWL